MTIQEQYELWLANAAEFQDVLTAMDDATRNDAFYRDLAFGTGGLRGVIGVGTNRMNVYTVAKASQGLADYVVKHFAPEARRIAVSYDSRNFSREFAEVASEVFAANGIRVSVYKTLMPTPCLSYATRELGCAAGVMVTASHNPAKYNGYKVYGADGCQITTDAADEILACIDSLDIFRDVKRIPFAEGIANGVISYIPDAIYDAFTEEVKGTSVLFGDEVNKNVSIVYSPLNGTGLCQVTRVLAECGFKNVYVVPEQKMPDGNFPTCPYPNPEIREAMALGIECARAQNADLLLATDPDCDRVGIAVKNAEGEFVLLSGNETGLLLLDYVCAQKTKHGKMPASPVMVKTIVTMDLAEKIAAAYGVTTVNVLTGFKFIGEQIGALEKEGRRADYLFGFEESYGYLSGTYVRDKDAVNAAYLICEMFAYYRTRGISLLEKLNELYATYGYCLNTLHSYEFEGQDGMLTMQRVMAHFRAGVTALTGIEVVRTDDYVNGLNGLPPADVIKFILPSGSVVVRPSGTEPKLKVYLSVVADGKPAAMAVEERLNKEITEQIYRV